MKAITLVALTVVILLELSGALPRSSVGGALTLALLLLVAALAVGLDEAWSRKRGVLGWMVNIVASFIGGFIGAGLGGMAMEAILPSLHLDGSLAASRHPLLYVALAGMTILTLLGAWTALWTVNRFR